MLLQMELVFKFVSDFLFLVYRWQLIFEYWSCTHNFNISFCFGLNVCVCPSPQTQVEILTPKYNGISRWGLWESGNFMNEISTL